MNRRSLLGRRAHVASGQSLGAVCPNCGEWLDGWTGANMDPDGRKPIPKNGDPTVCIYCAALLVFTSADGDLRVATAADRERFFADPEMAALLREFQQFAVLKRSRQ